MDLGLWRLFLPSSLQDLDGLKEIHLFHQCPLVGDGADANTEAANSRWRHECLGQLGRLSEQAG